jgi:TPR repeat protein
MRWPLWGLVLALAVISIACRPAAAPLAPDETPQQHRLREDCQRGNAVSCRKLGQSLLASQRSDERIRRALAVLERGCELNDAWSCSEAGHLYLELPALQGDTRAVPRLRQACDGGVGVACQWLGNALWNRRHEMGAPAEIYRLYLRGCDLGDAGSCAQIGYALLDGEFELLTDDDWGDWLDRACDMDDADACYVLAARAAAQWPEAYHWAAPLLERVCKEGHTRSCALYATWLATGNDMPKDCHKVAQVAREACDRNDADACAALGWCGQAQERSLRNKQRRSSDELLREACQAGSEFGCYYHAARLAELAEPTVETIAQAAWPLTTKDGRTAPLVVVLERACQQGSQPGCTALGLAWLNGKTEANQQQGIQLLRRVCDDGHGKACLIAARAYRTGELVTRDLTVANDLFWRACWVGEREACNERPSAPATTPTPAPAPTRSGSPDESRK